MSEILIKIDAPYDSNIEKAILDFFNKFHYADYNEMLKSYANLVDCWENCDLEFEVDYENNIINCC